jgi:hypothetical protein
MEGHQLEIGRAYAFREKRSTSSPFLKVKLLDKVGRKGKLKVRFEDGPHPGLEEYVGSRQIVCAWGNRKTVLRDEEREARLAEHEKERGDDKALRDAVEAVFASTGEPGSGYDEDELQRILDRAGIDTAPADLHPVGFIDRHGRAQMPLDALAAVAKAFAAAEPQTVVGYLDDEEEENRLRGNQPGDRWYHQYQRGLSPGYALAHQWAGVEQEADMLREEIARLRMLVSKAAYDLKDAGKEHKSRWLLRALEGR